MSNNQAVLTMKSEKAPSLDSLLTNPSSIAMLSPETALRLLISFATIHPILLQRASAVGSVGADENELLTVEEVARKLKISEDKAYDLVRQGGLQRVEVGRLVRVRPSSLAAYIAGNTH
jgi:excisionase family DNA binding protein